MYSDDDTDDVDDDDTDDTNDDGDQANPQIYTTMTDDIRRRRRRRQTTSTANFAHQRPERFFVFRHTCFPFPRQSFEIYRRP